MRVLLIGANGGIGNAMLKLVLQQDEIDHVWATYRRQAGASHAKVTWLQCDAANEADVVRAVAAIDHIDRVINCVGLLHDAGLSPEKSIKQFQADALTRLIEVNTLPSLLFAKHLEPILRRSKATHFCALSARVGSIGDNRLGGWYSYRASKAALNMVLVNLANEWRYKIPSICVAGLHPGTVDTELSQPFQKNVVPEKLFAAEYSAECLWRVVSRLQAEDSGRVWAWDGALIPW